MARMAPSKQYNRGRFGWACALLFMLLLAAPAQFFAQNVTNNRLRQAAALLAGGNNERAEEELQSVLRASPNEYRALDLLGVIRVLQARETDAEKLFTQAVQIKPDFASGHAHLGLLYLQTERPEKAVPELSEAVRLDSGRTDAAAALVHIWRDQAQAAANGGDPATALVALADAKNLDPHNPDVQLEFGNAALQMSRWQDAIDAFQQTVRVRKDDPTALWGLARAYTGLSKFEDARRQFIRYIALRPDDSAGHCALGMTLAALERPLQARAQFEKSIALTPAQTESYYRLALLDLDSRNLESAAANLRHALEHDPNHPGALAALGRVQFEQKHYAEAIDLLQRGIAGDDSLGVAHYYLGLTYSRVGRKPESDQELQKAIQLGHQQAEKQRAIFKISGPRSAGAPATQSEKSPPQ